MWTLIYFGSLLVFTFLESGSWDSLHKRLSHFRYCMIFTPTGYRMDLFSEIPSTLFCRAR